MKFPIYYNIWSKFVCGICLSKVSQICGMNIALYYIFQHSYMWIPDQQFHLLSGFSGKLEYEKFPIVNQSQQNLIQLLLILPKGHKTDIYFFTFLLFSIFYISRILDPPSTNLDILICPSRYWNSDLYWFKSSTNQNSNFYQQDSGSYWIPICTVTYTCNIIVTVYYCICALTEITL